MSVETIMASLHRGVAYACIASFSVVGASAVAQEAADDEADGPIEEIVTVGSQIKGAQISDALAVSVVDAADIADLGIDSGDELLEFMAEQGSNFFAEAENISGGVNSARGDIGAYNLRNIGTGNTLVLLNGRRLVNSASYQTESVGGSFIPVNTVNAQSMPVFGLERVEVLRDGASAIYGADAVAGVVNYVMKTDYDGLSLKARYADYESLPRNDVKLSFEWGSNFNGGATNFSVFGSFYDRDPVNSQDDPKWADDDFRRLIPEGSPFEGDTSFRRSSLNSEYGQFDIAPDGSGGTTYGLSGLDITDSRGEFHVYPIDSEECAGDDTFAISAAVCGREDGGNLLRYNNNTDRDLYSDLQRIHLFAFLNHDFDNGMEGFTEFAWYSSDTTTKRQASTKLSAVAKHVIAPENYYNPFGPCTSPNRIPEADVAGVPCEGIPIVIDNYRWTAVPRIVDNDGETVRILTGLRGQLGDWDWEGAIAWSRAEKEDITHNRISNTIMDQLLADPTSSAYNPFNGGVDTNIEPALIDVVRENETELQLADVKFTNAELFEMPAGPVAFLAGAEFRREFFVDDRDPRLDGTIRYVDNSGNTYPFVSDVMNSSPTADSAGDRKVTSLFAEMQMPVFETLDVQLALRYEDFNDIGDTTVGKFAFGWRPIEQLLVRGSWSEAYRVPNLVTVNETGVARSNSRDDFVCFFVDPDQDTLDCNYGIQRTAAGSDELVPEKSDNTSFGFVLDVNEYLTVTLDYWQIEKEDTIGLFGEENHTALDLLNLLELGNSNCAGVISANPAVVRDDPSTLDPAEAQLFIDAGICPVGQIQRVDDRYDNLDTRNVRGHDIGVYFNWENNWGTWDLRYVAAFLDEYEQLASGEAAELVAAKEAGTLPGDVPVVGFASLVRQDSNPRSKQTARLRFSRNDWAIAVSGKYVGDIVENRAGLGSDGSKWILPSMQTYNASFDYRFDTFSDTRTRLRVGMNNIFDERAPLSSQRFGYWSDLHQDLGRSYYIDLKLTF